MVGYALAKLNFLGKRMIMLVVLATLMVPGSVTVIPLFVLMSKLGFVNTYWAVILPFAVGPFGVFLMRQFMLGIPDDLLEAARVDGAGEFFIFWRIVAPLSLPGMAALGIITFLATWNNFLWPLIVLTDEHMYTLPVALGTFAIGQHQADYGLLMAGAVALVLPIVIVFLILQRQFTESIATTGLKG
jgi:multiple sugar transport system permease protein